MKRNIITAFLSQIITIIYGLIIPRIILDTFGSEINGLVSSITQFLSYITLLEGGLMSVIMASLYEPIANNDTKKISSIFQASKMFFRKIAYVYIAYVLLLAIVYPIKVRTVFDYKFVFFLVFSIAGTLFIQYFYSLNLKILILASKNGYIVYSSQIVLNILNIIITILIVNICPNIIMLKLCTCLAYFVQPVIYTVFLRRKITIDNEVEPDNSAISKRWDAFGQNLAYFIHSNTDIVVLSLLSSFLDVSIYTTYLLVINSVKTMVIAISSAIIPSLGTVMVGNNIDEKNDVFKKYEFGITIISTIGFSCCIVLITPFIMLYTRGITDANYNQFLFGIIMTIAEYCYCVRDPYVSVAYACGKFKETSLYAYLEAVFNILISVIFVSKFGLIGVAIGTFVSMLYRMFAHVLYLKKDILYRPVIMFFKSVFPSALVIVCSILLSVFSKRYIYLSIIQWIILALCSLFVVSVITVILNYIFRKTLFSELVIEIKKSINKLVK